MWDVAALNPPWHFSESEMWTFRELPQSLSEPEGMIFPGIMEVIVLVQRKKKNDNAEEGKNHETEQNIHFSICYISYQAVDLKSSIWCVVWTPSSSWKPVQFSKFSVQLRIILPHHRRGEELREEKEMRQEETSLPLNLNWHQLSVQWSELSCECERSEEVKCMVPNRRLRIEMRMYGEDTQGMLQ